jgi:hypothetical protein
MTRQPLVLLAGVMLSGISALFILTSQVAALTVSFDFTGATIGASCDTVITGPYIVSALNGVDSVTNTSNAGGTAPECQAPLTTQITLTQPATAIAFRAFKGNGSIGVEYFVGAGSVGTDSIPSGVITNYSRTITFDRIRIFEVTSLSPIYLDNIVFTFPDPVPPTAAPGSTAAPIIEPPYDPGDDRIAPAIEARFNLYCRDYGLVVYVGSNSFLVERSLMSAGEIPTVNTLLAEQNGVRLYRLKDGLFQAMITPDGDGKQEFVIFELVDVCTVNRWRRGHFSTVTVQSTIYLESSPNHWTGYPYHY